jgi:hypothetical protein
MVATLFLIYSQFSVATEVEQPHKKIISEGGLEGGSVKSGTQKISPIKGSLIFIVLSWYLLFINIFLSRYR